MPSTPATTATTAATATFAVRSADGTALRGWTAGGDGPPLLLSNGLGSVPQAWPALTPADSGYRVLSWYHRGSHGSDRPADPARVRVADHVDDALAVLDAQGVERALVASWSIGVNVAFELALRAPDRVAGLLAVGGVPGGTFATMGGPLRVPRRLRRPLAAGAAGSVRRAGPVLSWLTPRLPVDRRIAWLLAHSGFMLPGADLDVLVPLLRAFLDQDWGWYMHLALAADEHAPLDLSALRCPTTLVAGRHDLLTSVDAVVAAAGRIPQAEVVVLPGSHFLPVEQPGQVHAALDALRDRSNLT